MKDIRHVIGTSCADKFLCWDQLDLIPANVEDLQEYMEKSAYWHGQFEHQIVLFHAESEEFATKAAESVNWDKVYSARDEGYYGNK